MPITAYDASVALFVRALTNLKALLHKGEQYAAEHGIAESELLESRLAPSDTHDLSSQAYWTTEAAKRTLERLLDVTYGTVNDDAKTFAQLQQRIDATIAQLQGVTPSDVEAGLSRSVEYKGPRGTLQFTGDRFLREYAIPSLFFHLTCAYAILRQRGVEVSKGDFQGSLR